MKYQKYHTETEQYEQSSQRTIHNLENHEKQETEESINFDQKFNYGRWTTNEQILYIQFSQTNSLDMSSKKNRRSSKVFRKMSKIIITRSADQCRSHHQKMQRKYGSIFNIVSIYKRAFQKSKRKQQTSLLLDGSVKQFNSKIKDYSQNNSSNYIQTKTTKQSKNQNEQDLLCLQQQYFSSNCSNIEIFLNYHLDQNIYNNDWLL